MYINFDEILKNEKKNPPENFIFPMQHLLAVIFISFSLPNFQKKNPVKQINKKKLKEKKFKLYTDHSINQITFHYHRYISKYKVYGSNTK